MTMASTYQVEVHDGSCWSFGIRYDRNRNLPIFCDVESADVFSSRKEAKAMQAWAERICGGTMRTHRLP